MIDRLNGMFAYLTVSANWVPVSVAVKLLTLQMWMNKRWG
jgi:hypothetical protein